MADARSSSLRDNDDWLKIKFNSSVKMYKTSLKLFVIVKLSGWNNSLRIMARCSI
jgi:hypothetical protein